MKRLKASAKKLKISAKIDKDKELKENFGTGKHNNQVKSLVEVLNSRMEGTEERMSELGDRKIEVTQSEQRRENRMKTKLAASQGLVRL